MLQPRFFQILSLLLLALASGPGCRQADQPPPSDREMLVYCGITMIEPIRRIADMFETRHNCVIKIIKGGSGDLYRSIQANQVGDLYLPGLDSYMQAAIKEGLVTRTVEVGVNRAALVVRRGNPLGLDADLRHLTDKRLRVVLASAESGSIGRETESILKAAGILTQAMENTLFFTTDSKNLSKALREDKADLTLNWAATVSQPANRDLLQVLPLNPALAPPQVLELGILRFSAFPDLAGAFLDLAIAAEGQAVFRAHGFSR